jgi:hypothetical protein
MKLALKTEALKMRKRMTDRIPTLFAGSVESSSSGSNEDFREGVAK